MPRPNPRDVIQNWPQIAIQLNPAAGWRTGNCPAVAAAVNRYLETGELRPAMSGIAGGFIIDGLARAGGGIAGIMRQLRADGDHCLVSCDEHNPPAGRHHEFNLLRAGGRVHYLDAYTRPAVCATDVAARTSWAQFFEWGRVVTCRAAGRR